MTLEEKDVARFWSKTKRSGECISWNAGVSNCGYGYFWLNGKQELAHRVSVFLSGRTIPEKRQIDHLCRNKRCVNPSHLEVVSARENCIRSKPDFCKRGHPLFGTNLFIDIHNARQCRICKRMHLRKWEKRNRNKYLLYKKRWSQKRARASEAQE